MPIDTRLDGRPDDIHACARWLRSQLAGGVDGCVTSLHRVRDDATLSWHGDAGPHFQARMQGAAVKADGLRADVERAAGSFDAYADDLHTALAGMARARDIAATAGLQVQGDVILDPGPAPVVPALSAGDLATPELARAHGEAVAAAEAHERRVEAYARAADEAERSRRLMEAARGIGKNIWDDLRGKALLQAADLVNSAAIGGLAAAHTSALKGQAKTLLDESRLAGERYLRAPGGSAQARALNDEAYRKFLEADEYSRRAESVGRRVGSKIPIVGLGITAAGIGYDIHEGKPVGKAVVSGVGGALAAAGTGAVIGTMIGGPVGTVVGAGAGLVVGLVVSGSLDWGYDQLPPGVTESIENGIGAVTDAIGDAGEAVGDGARKVWDSLF